MNSTGHAQAVSAPVATDEVGPPARGVGPGKLLMAAAAAGVEKAAAEFESKALAAGAVVGYVVTQLRANFVVAIDALGGISATRLGIVAACTATADGIGCRAGGK